MAESNKYFQKNKVEVARGKWVRIKTAKGRTFTGKVLSVDGPHAVFEDGKVKGYQYMLEISEENGTGYALNWKQWLEPDKGGAANDGGTFKLVQHV